ncbi:hypothetical protein [Leptolyngbya sp. CCY15150]|uniref:hypothetical protein n=1 Tax=Leptolyngbya sp. CCY15150 TaxID=2767772 RepID=UPI00194FA83D|nr:hypothetical protein [Leptolyngbya sp. CCY15150]
MGNLDRVTLYATLGDLPLHDFQVNLNTSGLVIAKQFEQRPDLPGVVIMSETKMVGVISRRRFHEQMSKPAQQKTFLEQPIQMLLEAELKRRKARALILRDTEPIDLSARTALNRPADEVYEPIIVMFQDHSIPEVQAYFLLDMYTLLQAQSQILMVINQEMSQQRAILEEKQQQVQEGQRKVEEYTQLLEAHQGVIQERNLLLETQQVELLEQAREIAQFNKRFMRIGQLLSAEGQQTFQATFAGVNAICHNTTQIVGIGRSLTDELHTIQDTSQLIAKVSQQVRHLSVQAAIVANHVGVEMAGFSHITAEIGKLVNQTLDAGRRMDRLASRFHSRVQALTDSAQSGTTVAQSLLQKIEQAQTALAELERLVQGPIQSLTETDSSATLGLSPNIQDATQELIQKIATAEATVTDLEQFLHRRDSEPLIQKIKRALEQNRHNLSP